MVEAATDQAGAGASRPTSKALVACGLGWGSLMYEAAVLTLLFRADHLFLGWSGWAVFFLWVGFPLLVSIAGTVLYLRLPKDQQRAALIAPVSLLIVIVVPVLLLAWVLYEFGKHGPA